MLKRYGFFIVSRVQRWRTVQAGGEASDWMATEAEAKALLDEWSAKRQEKQLEAMQEVEAEREKFVAEASLEIVTVGNPNFLQADHRKPTVTLPDGSHLQFEEGTPEEKILSHMRVAAERAHPAPDSGDGEFAGPGPGLEKVDVWEASLFLDGERRALPDIGSWEFFFPIEAVITQLEELAKEGWAIAHVSEDRGVYSSKLASSISAPVATRYLLVREQ